MQCRFLLHMVDDQDLVGQIEHEVALIAGPRQLQRHRLKLEHQIIAEGAVKAEMPILGAGEEPGQSSQHREQAGLPAALLLGKALIGCPHRTEQAIILPAQTR